MKPTTQSPASPAYYSQFIGQEGVKKRLSRYIKSFNVGGYAMPAMIFLGARGHGKTEIAEATFPLINLRNGSGSRDHCIINCAQFKTADQFFQEAIAPTQGMEVTFLLDECHCLPESVQSALLTVFNPNGQKVKNIFWKGEEYTIDLNEQTFIFATTEPDKMLKTLIQRLKNITFCRYTNKEIGKIILVKDLDVTISPEILDEMARTCRKSPRIATDLVDDLNRYASGEDIKHFGRTEWDNFMAEMDVKLYGIDNNEFELLKVLDERGECSLGELASALCMTSTSIQRGVEDYLLNMRMMEIDGKRRITAFGRKALKEILAKQSV